MKLPRIHRVVSRGILYKYHRRTRAELPTDMPEDHPDFISAWAAEEAKGPSKKSKSIPGSVAAGCEAYLASGGYRDLSDSYRPVIRRHVEEIKKQVGKAKISDLRSHHVSEDLDPLTPAVARSRLKAWRKLGKFWRSKDIISEDFTVSVSGKKMPKTGGHKEWTTDDVDSFRRKQRTPFFYRGR